jgi:hypothetical protein
VQTSRPREPLCREKRAVRGAACQPCALASPPKLSRRRPSLRDEVFYIYSAAVLAPAPTSHPIPPPTNTPQTQNPPASPSPSATSANSRIAALDAALAHAHAQGRHPLHDAGDVQYHRRLVNERARLADRGGTQLDVAGARDRELEGEVAALRGARRGVAGTGGERGERMRPPPMRRMAASAVPVPASQRAEAGWLGPGRGAVRRRSGMPLPGRSLMPLLLLV